MKFEIKSYESRNFHLIKSKFPLNKVEIRDKMSKFWVIKVAKTKNKSYYVALMLFRKK